jgi:MFS family permease
MQKRANLGECAAVVSTRRAGAGAASTDGRPGISLRAAPPPDSPALRWMMNRIIVAGCLAMVYVELTAASPRDELLRQVGASYGQFGVLGAVPHLMLLMQFVSGLLVKRLRRRKFVWIALLVTQRAMPIPFALLPCLFPGLAGETLVWCMIATLAIGEASANLGTPMWFSWMGDLLPHHSMCEFWGHRRRWLSATSAASLLMSAGFFFLLKETDIRVTYLVAALAGSAAGIWDILLFLKIEEPRLERSAAADGHLLLQPFRDRDFIGFIFYSAYWSFAAAMAYTFFRIYLLKELRVPVFVVLFLFTFHALGGTLLTRRIGRLCDRYGNRPVLILCTSFKSLVVIGMFLCRPGWWLLLLIPVFIADNLLNTGMLVAQSGYMLKSSPRQNRSMYVAALLATTGLAGALSSLVGGQILEALAGRSWDVAGMVLTNFHVVFGLSIVLRWTAILVALKIREPKAGEPGEVLTEAIVPAVLNWLALPAGLFARDED